MFRYLFLALLLLVNFAFSASLTAATENEQPNYWASKLTFAQSVERCNLALDRADVGENEGSGFADSILRNGVPQRFLLARGRGRGESGFYLLENSRLFFVELIHPPIGRMDEIFFATNSEDGFSFKLEYEKAQVSNPVFFEVDNVLRPVNPAAGDHTFLVRELSARDPEAVAVLRQNLSERLEVIKLRVARSFLPPPQLRLTEPDIIRWARTIHLKTLVTQMSAVVSNCREQIWENPAALNALELWLNSLGWSAALNYRVNQAETQTLVFKLTNKVGVPWAFQMLSPRENRELDIFTRFSRMNRLNALTPFFHHSTQPLGLNRGQLENAIRTLEVEICRRHPGCLNPSEHRHDLAKPLRRNRLPSWIKQLINAGKSFGNQESWAGVIENEVLLEEIREFWTEYVHQSMGP